MFSGYNQGSMVKAVAYGIVVAFLCILPPIVHFVTGPLSPAIGGFVGGYSLPGRRPSVRSVLGLAALMTLALTVLITVTAAIGLTIAVNVSDGERAFDAGIVVLVALISAGYVFALSFLGGLFGASFRR